MLSDSSIPMLAGPHTSTLGDSRDRRVPHPFASLLAKGGRGSKADPSTRTEVLARDDKSKRHGDAGLKPRSSTLRTPAGAAAAHAAVAASVARHDGAAKTSRQ